MLNKNIGITLVSLTVTIIVLLILAGVTLSTVLGDNGVLNIAKGMAANTEEKNRKSSNRINDLEAKIAKSEQLLATASPEDVISGKTFFSDNEGTLKEGTMTKNEAKSITLNAGSSYTIPRGYHNGEGTITTTSLSIQTSATAIASQILSGYTAWVNGTKITGTMTNQGEKTATLNAGGSYTIPAGYHNGKGVIKAASLASQTQADAIADNLSNGKTAWVNGTKITGTGADVTNSYNSGYTNGNSDGYNSGYTAGYNAGKTDLNFKTGSYSTVWGGQRNSIG